MRLRRLRDVDRQVGHALEVHRDVGERLQQAQVARDRELRGDRLEHALLDADAARVELVVAGDDGLGQVDVTGDERLDRVARLLGDHEEDVDDLGVDRFEFLAELLAHDRLLGDGCVSNQV